MTQQNAAMVEKSTAATHSLSQEIAQLSGLVGEFQINRTEGNESLRREFQKVATRDVRAPPRTSAA